MQFQLKQGSSLVSGEHLFAIVSFRLDGLNNIHFFMLRRQQGNNLFPQNFPG